MPNECWQSDFTHYRLTDPNGAHSTADGMPGVEVEIIAWLDDCTRYALHVSAHRERGGVGADQRQRGPWAWIWA